MKEIEPSLYYQVDDKYQKIGKIWTTNLGDVFKDEFVPYIIRESFIVEGSCKLCKTPRKKKKEFKKLMGEKGTKEYRILKRLSRSGKWLIKNVKENNSKM